MLTDDVLEGRRAGALGGTRRLGGAQQGKDQWRHQHGHLASTRFLHLKHEDRHFYFSIGNHTSSLMLSNNVRVLIRCDDIISEPVDAYHITKPSSPLREIIVSDYVTVNSFVSHQIIQSRVAVYAAYARESLHWCARMLWSCHQIVSFYSNSISVLCQTKLSD